MIVNSNVIKRKRFEHFSLVDYVRRQSFNAATLCSISCIGWTRESDAGKLTDS